jgi:hypothetical protein
MDGTVVNKAISYERAFSEIKRLASAGLEGPELLRRTAERLSMAVPFGPSAWQRSIRRAT